MNHPIKTEEVHGRTIMSAEAPHEAVNPGPSSDVDHYTLYLNGWARVTFRRLNPQSPYCKLIAESEDHDVVIVGSPAAFLWLAEVLQEMAAWEMPIALEHPEAAEAVS